MAMILNMTFFTQHFYCCYLLLIIFSNDKVKYLIFNMNKFQYTENEKTPIH